MAEHPTTNVKARDFATFKEFQAELARNERSHIRLVKVDDQGLVEPAKQGTAFVMQPRVRIVVTAFDYKTNEILRWQLKWDVGTRAITSNGQPENGSQKDATGARTRDQTVAALELRGYQVSQGEWTPTSIEDILAHSANS